MNIVKTDQYIYISADENKILTYGNDTFICAYMPLDTDVSLITEIDEQSLVDDSVALEELKEAING